MRRRDALLKTRQLLLGTRRGGGLVFAVVTYALLAGIGYVYVYPILSMVVNSLKDLADVVSPVVRWIPRRFYTGNYAISWAVLNLPRSFFDSLLAASVPAVLQTATTALVGYGFARFTFPLKRLALVLVLATFLIPVQVTLVPRYILFDRYHMIGTLLPLFLPALLAQGIKSAIFILLFYQFFRMIPVSLEQAADLDGAGKLRIFLTIAVPLSVPALIVSVLFSFVWYWNETYVTGLFLGQKLSTLPLALRAFVDSYNRLYPASDGSAVNRINESIRTAGTLITVAPLMILYLLLQKQFVEGIDRTGITGE